jgi:hypothetical protein
LPSSSSFWRQIKRGWSAAPPSLSPAAIARTSQPEPRGCDEPCSHDGRCAYAWTRATAPILRRSRKSLPAVGVPEAQVIREDIHLAATMATGSGTVPWIGLPSREAVTRPPATRSQRQSPSRPPVITVADTSGVIAASDRNALVSRPTTPRTGLWLDDVERFPGSGGLTGVGRPGDVGIEGGFPVHRGQDAVRGLGQVQCPVNVRPGRNRRGRVTSGLGCAPRRPWPPTAPVL